MSQTRGVGSESQKYIVNSSCCSLKMPQGMGHGRRRWPPERSSLLGMPASCHARVEHCFGRGQAWGRPEEDVDRVEPQCRRRVAKGEIPGRCSGRVIKTCLTCFFNNTNKSNVRSFRMDRQLKACRSGVGRSTTGRHGRERVSARAGDGGGRDQAQRAARFLVPPPAGRVGGGTKATRAGGASGQKEQKTQKRRRVAPPPFFLEERKL